MGKSALRPNRQTGRPNILLLMTDEHRFDAVGANGNPAVQTPNLDQLAAEGMNFRRTYSVCAVCSPARASMMTGLYPHRHMLLTNATAPDAIIRRLPDDTPLLPRLLSDAGYQTGLAGKWHVGGVPKQGEYGFQQVFQIDHEPAEFRGLSDSCDVVFPPGVASLGRPLVYSNYGRCIPGRPLHAQTSTPAEETSVIRMAHGGIELLRSMAPGTRNGRPFFLNISWSEPHPPNYVPAETDCRFPPESIPVLPNWNDSHQGKPRTGPCMAMHYYVTGKDWEWWSSLIARYYGAIALIDEAIGRVLRELDALGLAEETLVLWVVDHGGMVGGHGLLDKGPVGYEELCHLPFVARWPGHAAPGSTSDAFVQNFDIFPTILQAAGLPIPEGTQAKSQLPLLQGRTPANWRRNAFCQYHGDMFGLAALRMVRTERYKFVYHGWDVCELYDSEKDPWELHNVVFDPAYRAAAMEMACCLADDLDEWDDPLRRVAPRTLREGGFLCR